MAARKDDSRKPPEGGRRAAIWRLPAARAPDDSSAAPSDAEADRPRDRRVPLPVVLGLVAALVGVGLYAGWSAIGPAIWSASGEPDTSAAPAPASTAATRAGDGPGEGGASQLPPGEGGGVPPPGESGGVPPPGEGGGVSTPGDGGGAPLVGAEEDTEAGPADDAAPAADPPPSSAALAGDAPQTTPAAVPDGAAAVQVAAPSAAAPAVAGPDALGILAARLEALEAWVAGAVGGAGGGSAGGGGEAAVTALAQRVRALEDDPVRAPLERALAEWSGQRAALEAALAEVGARFAHIEAEAARQAAADGHLVTLALTTGTLTAALGSSRGFAPTLDALHGIAGKDPDIESALARLTPFAAAGVPTLDRLRARFPEAANAIVRAAPGTDDADWIDETVTRLSQLVTIRRTSGALDPQSVDGRLADAEAALAVADLGRAIAIVAELTEGVAEDGRARLWLRDARARYEADDALAALVASVHARIGARWAPAGAPP